MYLPDVPYPVKVLEGQKPPNPDQTPEREIFVGNLLVRIRFIIVMVRWAGLAPWEFELHFPGSLAFTGPHVFPLWKGCWGSGHHKLCPTSLSCEFRIQQTRNSIQAHAVPLWKGALDYYFRKI